MGEENTKNFCFKKRRRSFIRCSTSATWLIGNNRLIDRYPLISVFDRCIRSSLLIREILQSFHRIIGHLLEVMFVTDWRFHRHRKPPPGAMLFCLIDWGHWDSRDTEVADLLRDTSVDEQLSLKPYPLKTSGAFRTNVIRCTNPVEHCLLGFAPCTSRTLVFS